MGPLDLLKGCTLNPPATEESIRKAEVDLGCAFPPDYVEFLQASNGATGYVGAAFINFWKAESLRPFNDDLEAQKYVPGLVLIGTDGGGAGYGFDSRELPMPVFSVELIGMNWEEADRMASRFTDLVEILSR